MRPVRVVVVGSLNEDLVIRVPRLPAPGETVTGNDHHRYGGGKGANQAIAAARLGADVAMVGRVGADRSGRELKDGLAAEGVDVTYVTSDAVAPTGLALIYVAEDGENTIAVSPGANSTLAGEHVRAAARVLAAADVVLTQLEISDECVAAAATSTSGMFIINAAPARPLDPSLPIDVLIVNETEWEVLSGRPLTSDGIPGRQSGSAPIVVVTRGSRGATLVSADGRLTFPAPSVEAVDTTAAGDAFCGALAVRLAEGRDAAAAVAYAVAAGAAATLRFGAQPSLPYPADIDALRS